MFRWTQHNKNAYYFDEPDKIVDTLTNNETIKTTALKSMVFQLEVGKLTGKRHYQGFLQLSKKIRPKSLAAALNHDFFGIEISAAKDTTACKRYVTKQETRIDGPWTFPKLTMDQIL